MIDLLKIPNSIIFSDIKKIEIPHLAHKKYIHTLEDRSLISTLKDYLKKDIFGVRTFNDALKLSYMLEHLVAKIKDKIKLLNNAYMKKGKASEEDLNSLLECLLEFMRVLKTLELSISCKPLFLGDFNLLRLLYISENPKIFMQCIKIISFSFHSGGLEAEDFPNEGFEILGGILASLASLGTKAFQKKPGSKKEKNAKNKNNTWNIQTRTVDGWVSSELNREFFQKLFSKRFFPDNEKEYSWIYGGLMLAFNTHLQKLWKPHSEFIDLSDKIINFLSLFKGDENAFKKLLVPLRFHLDTRSHAELSANEQEIYRQIFDTSFLSKNSVKDTKKFLFFLHSCWEKIPWARKYFVQQSKFAAEYFFKLLQSIDVKTFPEYLEILGFVVKVLDFENKAPGSEISLFKNTFKELVRIAMIPFKEKKKKNNIMEPNIIFMYEFYGAILESPSLCFDLMTTLKENLIHQDILFYFKVPQNILNQNVVRNFDSRSHMVFYSMVVMNLFQDQFIQNPDSELAQNFYINGLQLMEIALPLARKLFFRVEEFLINAVENLALKEAVTSLKSIKSSNDILASFALESSEQTNIPKEEIIPESKNVEESSKAKAVYLLIDGLMSSDKNFSFSKIEYSKEAQIAKKGSKNNKNSAAQECPQDINFVFGSTNYKFSFKPLENKNKLQSEKNEKINEHIDFSEVSESLINIAKEQEHYIKTCARAANNSSQPLQIMSLFSYELEESLIHNIFGQRKCTGVLGTVLKSIEQLDLFFENSSAEEEEIKRFMKDVEFFAWLSLKAFLEVSKAYFFNNTDKINSVVQAVQLIFDVFPLIKPSLNILNIIIERCSSANSPAQKKLGQSLLELRDEKIIDFLFEDRKKKIDAINLYAVLIFYHASRQMSGFKKSLSEEFASLKKLELEALSSPGTFLKKNTDPALVEKLKHSFMVFLNNCKEDEIETLVNILLHLSIDPMGLFSKDLNNENRDFLIILHDYYLKELIKTGDTKKHEPFLSSLIPILMQLGDANESRPLLFRKYLTIITELSKRIGFNFKPEASFWMLEGDEFRTDKAFQEQADICVNKDSLFLVCFTVTKLLGLIRRDCSQEQKISKKRFSNHLFLLIINLLNSLFSHLAEINSKRKHNRVTRVAFDIIPSIFIEDGILDSPELSDILKLAEICHTKNENGLVIKFLKWIYIALERCHMNPNANKELQSLFEILIKIYKKEVIKKKFLTKLDIMRLLETIFSKCNPGFSQINCEIRIRSSFLEILSDEIGQKNYLKCLTSPKLDEIDLEEILEIYGASAQKVLKKLCYIKNAEGSMEKRLFLKKPQDAEALDYRGRAYITNTQTDMMDFVWKGLEAKGSGNQEQSFSFQLLSCLISINPLLINYSRNGKDGARSYLMDILLEAPFLLDEIIFTTGNKVKSIYVLNALIHRLANKLSRDFNEKYWKLAQKYCNSWMEFYKQRKFGFQSALLIFFSFLKIYETSQQEDFINMVSKQELYTILSNFSDFLAKFKKLEEFNLHLYFLASGIFTSLKKKQALIEIADIFEAERDHIFPSLRSKECRFSYSTRKVSIRAIIQYKRHRYIQSILPNYRDERKNFLSCRAESSLASPIGDKIRKNVLTWLRPNKGLEALKQGPSEFVRKIEAKLQAISGRGKSNTLTEPKLRKLKELLRDTPSYNELILEKFNFYDKFLLLSLMKLSKKKKIYLTSRLINIHMGRSKDLFLGCLKANLQIQYKNMNNFIDSLLFSLCEAENKEPFKEVLPEVFSDVYGVLQFINGLIKSGVAMPFLIDIQYSKESGIVNPRESNPTFSKYRQKKSFVEILISIIKSKGDNKITNLCIQIILSINNWIKFREKEALLIEDKKIAHEVWTKIEENRNAIEKQIIQAAPFLVEQWFYSKNDIHIEHLMKMIPADLNYFKCLSSALAFGIRSLLQDLVESIKKIVDTNPLELENQFLIVSQEINMHYQPDFIKRLYDLRKLIILSTPKLQLREQIWEELTIRHIFETFGKKHINAEQVKCDCISFSEETSILMIHTALESLSSLINNSCQALNVLAEFQTLKTYEKTACENQLIVIIQSYCEYIYDAREHKLFKLRTANEEAILTIDKENLPNTNKENDLRSKIFGRPNFRNSEILKAFDNSIYYQSLKNNFLQNNENLEKRIGDLFSHFLSISPAFFSTILLKDYKRLRDSRLNLKDQYLFQMYNYLIENFGSSIGNTNSFANAKRIYLRIRTYGNLGLDPNSDGLLQWLHINRNNVWESTFRQLWRYQPKEILKYKFKIEFENEPGVDGGGLYREWTTILLESVLKPRGGYFIKSQSNNCYLPDPELSSNMANFKQNFEEQFKFMGRIIAKLLVDGVSPGVSFGRYFLKRILDKQLTLEDLKDVNEEKMNTLIMIKRHNLDEIEHFETFRYEGRIDLIANGSRHPVTENNKIDYIRLVCQYHFKLMDAPTNAFKEGFNSIIPKNAALHLNECSLGLLLAGNQDINISEMKNFVVYNGFNPQDDVIIWLWKYLEKSSNEKRRNFVFFITGSAVLPEGGFKNFSPKITIVYNNVSPANNLPTSSTCYNQLKLPKYTSAKQLEEKLEKAIIEGSLSGFGYS